MQKGVKVKKLTDNDLPDSIKKKVVKKDLKNKIGSMTPEVAEKYGEEVEEVEEELSVKPASERLKVSYSEDDLDDYIWKGYIQKDITIISKKYVATFRSLTQKDVETINGKIQEAMENGLPGIKLAKGQENLRTKFMLASSVRFVNDQSTGKDLDERIKFIEGTAEWIFTYLSEKYNLFLLSLDEAFGKEGEELKND